MQKQIICIGAALVDELYSATAPMLLATTNDATVHRSAGGVSRNIAHQLALLGLPVQLISVLEMIVRETGLRQFVLTLTLN